MAYLQEFADQFEGFSKYWTQAVSLLDKDSGCSLATVRTALKRLLIPDYVIVRSLNIHQVLEVIPNLRDPRTITLKMLVDAKANDSQVFYERREPWYDSEMSYRSPVAAYKVRYQNRNEILKYVFDEIDKNLQLYQDASSNGYHSCHTSIIQGSMAGKSRRAHECLKEVFGFYLNFLPGGSGYPMRTRLVSDWLIDHLGENEWAINFADTEPGSSRFVDNQGLLDAFAFFAACLESLSSWLDSVEAKDTTSVRGAVAAWNAFQQNDAFWSNILRRSLVLGDSLTPDKTFSDTLTVLRSKLDAFFDRLPPNDLFPDLLRVLFVFDEADNLLKKQPYESSGPIQRITTVLEDCLRENPFLFALFIDTNPAVSQFSPVSQRLPSYKFMKVKRLKLFQPICGIHSFDVWPECNILDQTMLDIVQPMFYSVFGRAALHAHMHSLREWEVSDRAGQVLALLYNKLHNSIVGYSEKEIQLLSAVSTLAFRVKLEATPESALARGLVACKMQICMDFSDDRSRIFLISTAEPMIAVAAKSVTEYKGWDLLLRHLKECVSRRDVDLGEKREALSQMLLLMAADIVHDSSQLSAKMLKDLSDRNIGYENGQYVLPISLLDFLKQLLGRKLDDLDSLANEVEKSQPSISAPSISALSENVFMRLLLFDRFEHEPYQISNDLLAKVFYRSAGMMKSLKIKSIDARIPLLNLKLDDEESILDASISPDMFSVMSIQFQNYYQAPPIEEYSYWLNSMTMKSVCPNVVPPQGAARVALLIDMGEEPELKVYRFILKKEPRGVHTIALAVRGLKPSHFMPGSTQEQQIEADMHFDTMRRSKHEIATLLMQKSMFPFCFGMKQKIKRKREEAAGS